MSPEKQTDELVEGEAGEGEAPEVEKLNLVLKVDSPSACQRHVTVTIPRDDIERYYDKAFSELVETANVPGFRAGLCAVQVDRGPLSQGRDRPGQRLAADG